MSCAIGSGRGGSGGSGRWQRHAVVLVVTVRVVRHAACMIMVTCVRACEREIHERDIGYSLSLYLTLDINRWKVLEALGSAIDRCVCVCVYGECRTCTTSTRLFFRSSTSCSSSSCTTTSSTCSSSCCRSRNCSRSIDRYACVSACIKPGTK